MLGSGWGLILIAVVIAAGAVLCRFRAGTRWGRPSVSAFASLLILAVAFAMLVLVGGQRWAGPVFAAASLTIPCAVYVASVQAGRRAAQVAMRRPVRKAPTPTRRPSQSARPSAATPSRGCGAPVVAVVSDDAKRRDAPVQVVRIPQPPVCSAPAQKVPEARVVAPVVAREVVRLASAPAKQAQPAGLQPPKPQAVKPQPAASAVRGAPDDKRAEPAASRLRELSYADCLERARSLKGKGKPAIAARLLGEAAALAPDAPARRAARFDELACLVKAGQADRARSLAEELRSEQVELGVAERVKLDAVARMA